MAKLSMKDVAEKAKVSLTTVSRFINNSGYVAEEKKEAILNAMQDLGYTPKTSKSTNLKYVPAANLIGLVISHMNDNMFSCRLSAAIVHSAMLFQHQTVTACCNELTNFNLTACIKDLMQFPLSGLIICGFEESLSEESRIYLSSIDIPIVFIERTEGCSGFNRVEIDNASGMNQAVQHLILHGHKEILYLAYNFKNHSQKTRLSGFS